MLAGQIGEIVAELAPSVVKNAHFIEKSIAKKNIEQTNVPHDVLACFGRQI